VFNSFQLQLNLPLSAITTVMLFLTKDYTTRCCLRS